MDLAKFLAFKFPAIFILAILVVTGMFGGAVKYAYEANLDASKQKIELETKTKQLDQQRIELNELRKRVEDESKIREQMLDGKLSVLKSTERSTSVDKQITELINQYIANFSGLSQIQCGDDPIHNDKLRQAKAILGRLETLGELHQRVEATAFVKQQYNQSSIAGWQARCK